VTEHDKALVERLKRFSTRPIEHDAPAMNRVAMDEAAERIEAQAAEIERLRDALKIARNALEQSK
jgi:HAMP domain-containing protein